MRGQLPFLLSIPHGGTVVPAELRDRHRLTEADILDDIDLFTPSLYDLGSLVAMKTVAEIARPFVDLNRPAEQVPPRFPDGVVKSKTCWNVPVYRDGLEPDDRMITDLLERYHAPYHADLAERLRLPDIALMLDCHSMSEYPPPIAPDRDTRRPLVNLGDAGGTACPAAVTEWLADAFCSVFSFDRSEVTINQPFQGGYITRTHGNNPKPVIQMELNRALYLNPDEPHTEDPDRIVSVRQRITDTLVAFYERWRRTG